MTHRCKLLTGGLAVALACPAALAEEEVAEDATESIEVIETVEAAAVAEEDQPKMVPAMPMLVPEQAQTFDAPADAADQPAPELTEPTPQQGVPEFVEAPQGFSFLGVGAPLAFDMVTTEGELIAHDDLGEGIVVIEQWASWCPPCIDAIPDMKALNDEYGPKGVRFVGLNIDKTPEEMQKIVDDYDIDWAQVYDGSSAILSHWGPKVIPNVHIFSPDGELVWAGHPGSMEIAFHDALKDHMPQIYDPMKHIEAYKADEQRKADLAAAQAEERRQRMDNLKGKGWKVGDKPTFAFTTADGEEVNQDTYRGQLLILDFWATWCGPCMASMPHMKELYAEYKDKGVEVVGISYDRDEQTMRDTVAKHELNWVQTFDEEVDGKRQLGDAFAVFAIPSIWIISPDGEVLWIGHPMEMDEPFQDALKNHPPDAAQPPA